MSNMTCSSGDKLTSLEVFVILHTNRTPDPEALLYSVTEVVDANQGAQSEKWSDLRHFWYTILVYNAFAELDRR